MVKLYELTQFAVGVNGWEIPIGAEVGFYLSVAVDFVTGQSSGPAVTVTVSGGGNRDGFTVHYGSYRTKYFSGNIIRIQGNGATIELYASTPEKIEVTPQAVNAVVASGSVSVNNTVSTDIGTEVVSADSFSPSGFVVNNKPVSG